MTARGYFLACTRRLRGAVARFCPFSSLTRSRATSLGLRAGGFLKPLSGGQLRAVGTAPSRHLQAVADLLSAASLHKTAHAGADNSGAQPVWWGDLPRVASPRNLRRYLATRSHLATSVHRGLGPRPVINAGPYAQSQKLTKQARRFVRYTHDPGRAFRAMYVLHCGRIAARLGGKSCKAG